MAEIDLITLHQRLLSNDPTAPSDLFEAFYHELFSWIKRKFPSLAPGIDPDIYYRAAFQALDNYIKSPGKYNPALRGLRGYLRMAVTGDFLNLLQREQGRRRREVQLDNVAEPASDRNIENEGLEAAEFQKIMARLKAELSEEEGRVLDLIAARVRHTSAFAGVLGITDLPPEEQRRRVKQVKDRLKKRLKRRRKVLL